MNIVFERQYMNKCANCGIKTKNPKYCSRSCSVTSTNKTHKKRSKKEKFCKKCNKTMFGTNKYCSKECNPNYVDWSKITISDLLEKLPYFQVNARIRSLARCIFMQSDVYTNKCTNCKYDKHIEVCHIKPVKCFPKDATIEEINSVDNLISLCPNCHWEFDNGFLKLK